MTEDYQAQASRQELRMVSPELLGVPGTPASHRGPLRPQTIDISYVLFHPNWN